MPDDTALSPSARRVQRALHQRDFSFEVVELPDSTRTAQEAAEAVGCTPAQIAKSLLFRGQRTGHAFLVMASGSGRVDEAVLADHAGEAVALADPDFVRDRTGFAIGGVPPVGHATAPDRTWIDETLTDHPVVWAAAGTPRSVFSLDPAALPRLTGGTVVPLTE